MQGRIAALNSSGIAGIQIGFAQRQVGIGPKSQELFYAFGSADARLAFSRVLALRDVSVRREQRRCSPALDGLPRVWVFARRAGKEDGRCGRQIRAERWRA